MRIGCFQACSCVSSCYEFAKQALGVTITKLDEIRRDPEVFQKTCILALSVIRGINLHCHTNYFHHFIKVLDTAPAFDFYGFCRLPRLFLHPYVADRLDEYAILDQLEVILCDNWHLGIPDDQGCNRDPVVREFAQEQLNAFLEKMAKEEWDFTSSEEVKVILHNWFEKTLEADPHIDFDPHNISLQDLQIDLKKISWIETIITSTFIGIDIACVPDFLQGWGLIDLTPYTNEICRYPLLAGMTQRCLDDWIWGAMGIGHFLQFLNAAQLLWNGDLTTGEAKNSKWLLAASIAESLYCFSVVLRKDVKLINCLAIIAKSLGVIAFLVASKTTFFNNIESSNENLFAHT